MFYRLNTKDVIASLMSIWKKISHNKYRAEYFKVFAARGWLVSKNSL